MCWISIDHALPRVIPWVGRDGGPRMREGRPVGHSEHVLVWPYDPEYPETILAVYEVHMGRFVSKDSDTSRTGVAIPVTHWAPLPTGPQP